jgi:hypothetical protein
MVRLKRPSGAAVVAWTALFVALGGGAYAATHIANGSITHQKLARNSVWRNNLGRGAVQGNNLSRTLRSELATHNARGPRGATGPRGPQGLQGLQGPPGSPSLGASPSQTKTVTNVPSIASSSGKNPNPDSGDAGEQGFYFTGNGAGGSASLVGGELHLSGVGIDSNTAQGAIGIAKAFSNVPLGNLDALSYDWHVNLLKGNQAPTIHITVTGLTHDSHFGSGFANITYNPGLNNVTVGESQAYHSDGFAAGANWYSTTETNIGDPGGQNNPQTLAYFVTNNPNAVITQISLDNGGSSGATGSFDAGADNLILGFTGSRFSRYDFDG